MRMKLWWQNRKAILQEFSRALAFYGSSKEHKAKLEKEERLRNKREVIRLAEEMQANLREKRRNPEPLTPEEAIQKQQWRARTTPREECRHLKGAEASRWGVNKYGGPPRHSGARDYNLACHTFINFKTKIWCLNGCGFVSYPGDPNWKQAVEMFDLSTNTKSSSEIPATINPSRGKAV